MTDWLESKFTRKCHSGILFLHSLDSDPRGGDRMMTGRLEAFAKAFRNRFTMPSDIYVVPTSDPASTHPSQMPSQLLSQLKTMVRSLNGNGERTLHASIFPGVFKGQPETAWSAALLLLKSITRAQTKEFPASPGPALKRMPRSVPDARLALKDLADPLFKEFKGKTWYRDLDAIITLGQTALEFTPLEHSERRSALMNLTSLLSQRFDKEGRNEDLYELITLKHAMLEYISPEEPQGQTLLLELDDHLFECFKRTDSTVDLEEVISLRRVALERAPKRNRCRALLNLADALHEQFQKQGTANSIAEALSLAGAASRLLDRDHVLTQDHLASYLETTRLALNDLANPLSKKFKKKERDRDLNAMIALGKTALEFLPPNPPLPHSVLIDLMILLSQRFIKEGRNEDLDELIMLERAALEYVSPDEPQGQTLLLELDDHLFERFKRTDATVDLEEVISLRRVALERSPERNRCKALLNLADALHEQFQKQGTENSIAEAFRFARTALGLCCPGHPDHALSRNYLARYVETTQLALYDLTNPIFDKFKKERDCDLDAMITLGQTAFEFAPPQHPQRLSVLISLAGLLSERFNQERREEDLDKLITLKRAASEYMSPDDPQRQTVLLELDDHLLERFKLTDSMVDLEEIISLRRAALGRIPPPNRCRALLNLADALQEQFQKQGTEKSIAEALSLARAASGLCPPGHPDHALPRDHLASYLETIRLALNDLANPILEKFNMKESDHGLDAIITLGRTALEFTPSEHPLHHSTLTHLAGLILERFHKDGGKEDLDELITLKRAASEYMSPDEPQRKTVLLELDDHLSERFRRTDSMVDLEEIIYLRRAALVRIAPPNRCKALLNLANALHEQFQRQGLENSIAEAVSLVRVALSLCPLGHPDHALPRDRLTSYLQTKVAKRAARTRVRGPGAGPSSTSSYDIERLIKKAVTAKVEKIPLRLLHTPTGVLCNRDAQISYFEGSLQYKRILSLASSLDNQQLESEINNVIEEYFGFATLSHRWGSGEPLLRDVEGKSTDDLSSTDGVEKLQMFCALALQRNFQWAWSDTCCIDKDSSAELQEAIGSMFSWYRWSSLTIVHLSDVFDGGSLASSVWFTRGWTLQELLASRTILFYTRDWSLYSESDVVDHKSNLALLEELQTATGIAKQHLTNFYPGMDDARSRLHWASRRRTTRPEDIAYSLFGIFLVHLPIFYGESAQNALGRLLAEIISRSGDVSVLDWVGKPSSFNSCFPVDLAPYQTVPHFPLILSDSARHTSLDLDKAQQLYSSLKGLPRAGYVNSKLTLPSTVHPLTAVKLQGSSTSPTSPSRYTYEIQASRLRPLNVTLSVELDESVDTYILVRPWHPKTLEQQADHDVDVVWRLLEQLEQPFNALLLKRSLRNEYKRIACDCTITACIQDITSIVNSEVLIPEIV